MLIKSPGAAKKSSERFSFFQKISIRQKIILAVLLMILLPMSLAGLYFYFNITSILTENANNNLYQLIQQTNENIENAFNTISITSLHVLANPTIRAWTFNDTDFNFDYYTLVQKKYEIESELRYSLLFNNAWDSKLITTMYLFIDKTNFCSVSRSYQSVETINQNNCAIYQKTNTDLTKGIVTLPPSKNDPTIYFVRNVFNLNSPRRHLKLIIGTEESIFLDKYKKLLDYTGAQAFIMDGNGIIYSHPNESKLGKKIEKTILQWKDRQNVQEVTIHRHKYFIAFKNISNSNLIFVTGIPKIQVMKRFTQSIRNYLLITLFILVGCLSFSTLLSLRFTRFIKDLLIGFERVKSGNYNAKIPEYQDYELNLLSNTFNNMTGEIKFLINQVYEKQLLLKESEIKFLQSQMNPHFLFNVLTTISTKARLTKDETLYKMVISLSELLQAGIYSNNKTKITVRQELEYVQFYLYLQKMRFEDKLEYHINILDDSILDCYLPKLSVEPIVENAVTHGLENKLNKGTVIINAGKDNESVYFEIIDDGIGFEPDNINLDRSIDIVNRKKGHNNIGLNNTNRRIKLIYGEQYGIQIESEFKKGTKVMIHIPVDKEDRGEAIDV